MLLFGCWSIDRPVFFCRRVNADGLNIQITFCTIQFVSVTNLSVEILQHRLQCCHQDEL